MALVGIRALIPKEYYPRRQRIRGTAKERIAEELQLHKEMAHLRERANAALLDVEKLPKLSEDDSLGR